MNRDNTNTTSSPSTAQTLAPTATQGQFGPGSGDTAKHLGNAPALATAQTAAARNSAASATTTVDAGSVAATHAASVPLATTGERVDFTPDDVHARPATHSPSKTAPESENAALNFERS